MAPTTDRPGPTTPPRERPRDRLGRPLPWDAESEITLEDYSRLTLDQNHRLAMGHFDSGKFFQAHEAWEEAWRQARGTPDEEFFKGLAQLGAAYTHYLRGNAHGARALLGRALKRMTRYGRSHRGIRIASVSREFELQLAVFFQAEEEGTPLPAIKPPRLQ